MGALEKKYPTYDWTSNTKVWMSDVQGVIYRPVKGFFHIVNFS